MRKVALLAAWGGALVLAGQAAAGGWATVGLSPLPKDGMTAGAVWKPNIRVLQHGRTPVTNAEPKVEIRNADTGSTQTFTARPTKEPGVYAAEIAFPADGAWTYRVYDGFTEYGGARWHTFAPVQVVPAANSGRDWAPWAGGVAAALAGAGALALFGRRRRAQPEAVAST